MLMLAVFGHISSLGKDSSLLLISTGGVKLIQFKFYKNTRHLQISKVNVSFNSILSNNAWIDIVLIRFRIINMNMKYCWQHGKPFFEGGVSICHSFYKWAMQLNHTGEIHYFSCLVFVKKKMAALILWWVWIHTNFFNVHPMNLLYILIRIL